MIGLGSYGITLVSDGDLWLTETKKVMENFPVLRSEDISKLQQLLCGTAYK